MGDPLSEKSVSRALLRFGALTTAVVLAFGGATAGALAQEPETPVSSAEPTPSSEPSTPSSTPAPTPSSEPAPPSSTPAEPTAPATPSSTPDTPAAKPEEKVLPQVEGGDKHADLAVRADFDKFEYLPGQELAAKLTVTNNGDAPALNIRLSHVNQDTWIIAGAEELGSRPSLAPGQQKVINLKLRPKRDTQDSLAFTFSATVDGVSDPTPTDNGVTKILKVRQDKGSVTGLLYADKNGNGAPDGDEFLSNLSLHVTGGTPVTSRYTMTSASGEIRIDGLPAGRYSVDDISGYGSYVAKPGHSVFHVEPGKNTTLILPAVPSVDTVLDAKVEFERTSYQRDELLYLNITLTNRGNQPLTDVVAVCEQYNSDYLPGTGTGWKQLWPSRGGVSLAAGETKTVRVFDVVPPNLRFRHVYASCEFGNNGGNTDGYVLANNASTTIVGIYGHLNALVQNGETQAALPNTSVAILDAKTRRVLKSVKTDANGSLLAYDVPVGKVELVVAGRWKPSYPLVVDIQPDVTSYYRAWVVPGPEVPDLGKDAPDIEVTAKFEKTSFDAEEPVRAKVVVKHVGTGEAARVTLRREWVPGSLEFDTGQFGELGTGVMMWPGENREFNLVGQLPYHLAGDGEVVLKVRADGYTNITDPNQKNNEAEARAGVNQAKGDLSVVLYGDANGNGKRDAGEELDNTAVFAHGPVTRQSRTDESGRAVFREVPIGTFQVYGAYGNGWVEPGRTFVAVTAGAENHVEIGAVRAKANGISAWARFVKREYAAGENYELDLTIANHTGADLSGIKAFCSGPGEDLAEIHNDGAGWGKLAQDGEGVAVPNGHTFTFRVSDVQPKDAPNIGYATIFCTVGPDPAAPDAAQVYDEFQVRGKRGVGLAQVVREDPNGNVPVTDLPVVLVDKNTHEVVARTITDENGVFSVRDLPVGRYDVVVEGPWLVEFRHSNPYFLVRTGTPMGRQLAYLVPGPEVEDPGYPLPEDQRPAPVKAAAGGDALAKTGASVLGLGLVGALLVAFGLGASVIGRRKKA